MIDIEGKKIEGYNNRFDKNTLTIYLADGVKVKFIKAIGNIFENYMDENIIKNIEKLNIIDGIDKHVEIFEYERGNDWPGILLGKYDSESYIDLLKEGLSEENFNLYEINATKGLRGLVIAKHVEIEE